MSILLHPLEQPEAGESTTATYMVKHLTRLVRTLPLHPRPGLERIIQRNPSYDVRSLLDGVGGVLSSLVQRCLLAGDAAYLLAAFRPLPVPAADRAAATELLGEALRVGERAGLLQLRKWGLMDRGAGSR